MSPLRIAILECDTPLAHTKAKYGGYGGVFSALLHAGASSLRLTADSLSISKWDVVEKREYPNIDEIDAILMTGSRFNAFDDIPWINELVAYVQKILAQDRVRIVGICYGHQIVGRALGARVGRSETGWECSVCEVELTERGKSLFGGRDRLSIHQMHADIIHTPLPPAVEPLGSSPSCAIQGMYIPRRLLTVQGHPEFDGEIVTELLVARHVQGIFDDVTFQDAMGRVGRRQDGGVVGVGILRFLMDEDGVIGDRG